MSQLSWPSSESHYSFESAIDDAILKKVPLLIKANVVVNLTDRIFLKINGTALRIVGDSSGDADSRPLIISSAHSLFQIGGRGTRLIIENLRLRHICSRDENKDIGAVLFCLHKAKVEATNCEILSDNGFGVWAVQRASVRLSKCRVSSTSRSGCVSFGRSNLLMEECTIHDCHIHGVCSRGTTILTLKACEIMGSGLRGLYAYHQVTLSLEDTIIRKTKSRDHAAIDLWGCSLESSCRDNNTPSAEISGSGSVSAKLHDVNADTENFTSEEELDGMGSSSSGVEGNFTEVESCVPNCSSFNRIRDPESFSYKFPCRSRSEDNLSVNLIRCTISDNNGLGLRIRHGNSVGSGSQINGEISNCYIYDNAVGNVLQLVGELICNMMVLDSSTGVLEQQPRIPIVVPSIGSSLISEAATPECSSYASVTRTSWEYERDDPSSGSSQSAEHTSVSKGSSSGSWHPYDFSVSQHVQSKYAEFQSRTATALADACCRLRESAGLDEDAINDDDSSSDCGSDCSDGKSLCVLRDCEVRLPVPYSKYVIDFKGMQQTNTETHYTRSVRFREVAT